MTAHKHLKALVRARMKKTGERYAAARRQILLARSVDGGPAPALPPRDASVEWHFAGVIPAATALRVLLAHGGVRNPATDEPFDEAMTFGIAGGIGIGIFQFFYEQQDFASFFIGGRHLWHDDELYLRNALAAMQIKPVVEESTTARAAEKQLRLFLSRGPCVAWVDAASLPHRGMPPWMVGSTYHVVTVYREDGDDGVLIGDMTDNPVRLAMSDLTAARVRIKKHKCRLLQIDPRTDAGAKPDLKALVSSGLRRCRDVLLKPVMKMAPANFKLDALRDWAERIDATRGKDAWARVFPPGKHLWTALTSVHDFIENYGTGGGLCRPVFAEFLDTSAQLLKDQRLASLAGRYRKLGAAWSALADAALPPGVPMFARARELLDARSELLTAEPDGQATSAIWSELDALKQQAGNTFPLSDEDCRALRHDLRDRVLSLHSGETEALDALASVTG